MEKMTTKAEVLAHLADANTEVRADVLAMYADCYLDYREAAENIREHGNVVFHPRTGAPIPNPYAEVKARAMAGMLKLKGDIEGLDDLWLDG